MTARDSGWDPQMSCFCSKQIVAGWRGGQPNLRGASGSEQSRAAEDCTALSLRRSWLLRLVDSWGKKWGKVSHRFQPIPT